MSFSFAHYAHPRHGDLGVGKRPDELDWQDKKADEGFSMSLGQAARRVGLAPQTLIGWVHKGKLPVERRKYTLYIRLADVQRLAAER